MGDKGTLILEEEHHLIQQVVGAMAALAENVFEGRPAEKGTLVSMSEFMRVFVEKCHHEKEENHLFPLLVRKGVPVAGCPIGVLAHEHRTSAKLTAELGAAVEAYLKAPDEMGHFLSSALRAIVDLFPGHIWRENYLLFPMADKILDENEQRELVERFDAVEREIGPDVHLRFQQLAERLSERRET